MTDKDGDATANFLLAAMRDGNFAAVVSRFDARLKGALPEDKLAAVWTGQVAKLGALKSWDIVQRVDGPKQVRVALLKFESGQLQCLLSTVSETQELSGLFFKPAPKSVTVAPYVSPAAFRGENVSVGKAPFVLDGILTVPTAKGPFPGVVLVHGSGPHDKDESVGGNKPFRDLAEGLACRGVAVLRYDKRTFRYGDKLHGKVSIDDEVVEDAVEAVSLLKRRAEIDSRRIFVIGHSLGALLAPEIALRSAPLAGVVLLAPPGRAPWDAILAQMRYLRTPADQLVEFEQVVKRLKQGKFQSGTLLGVPASYWQDWASRDGVAMAKKLRKPILILRGERDYQVTEDDLAVWRQGLGGLADVEITTVPSTNHLFIKGTGQPGPAEYEIPAHVDEEVVNKLAVFLTGASPAVSVTRP